MEEKHHIDIGKVNEIIIEMSQLFNVNKGRCDLVSFTLEIEKVKSNTVALIASIKDPEMEGKHLFELHQLEEMVESCVFAKDNLTLEQVPQFKLAYQTLLDTIIEMAKYHNLYFLKAGEYTQKQKGLGLIVDRHSKQEVGTFELVYINPDHYGKLTVEAYQPIISESFQQLIQAKPDNYDFVYYSLDDELIYRLGLSDRIVIEAGQHEAQTIINLINSELKISKFEKSDAKYSIVEEANSTKIANGAIDSMDFLSSLDYDKFKESRLRIVDASREAAKKEKIFNQFAQIDLGF